MKPRRGPSLTPCKPPRLSRLLRDRALSVIRRIISVRRTSFFFRSSIRPQTFVPSPCRKPEITNNQTTQAIDFVLTHFHPDGSPWDPLGAPLAFLWLLKRPTGSLWRLSPPAPTPGPPEKPRRRSVMGTLVAGARRLLRYLRKQKSRSSPLRGWTGDLRIWKQG